MMVLGVGCMAHYNDDCHGADDEEDDDKEEEAEEEEDDDNGGCADDPYINSILHNELEVSFIFGKLAASK